MLLLLGIVAGNIQLPSKLDVEHLPEYLFVFDLDPPLLLLHVWVLCLCVLGSPSSIASIAHDGVDGPRS